MSTDRSVFPTEHLPNSYVSRRSTEAQALSDWTPPSGTLGELTDEARVRAATLTPRTGELTRAVEAMGPAPRFAAALRRKDVAIIAEVKRSSPSKGEINPGLDLELVARLTDIGQIDRQHVSTVDVLDILPAAFGLILLSDVVS